MGVVVNKIEYVYDAFDRRVGKRFDDDGDGTWDHLYAWLWDGQHEIMQMEDTDGPGTGQPFRTTHRYFYGDATDQLLADEQFMFNTGYAYSGAAFPNSGHNLWAIADHLGGVRDVVDNAGTVRQHVEFDSFGIRLKEIDYNGAGAEIPADDLTAIDELFGYTGRDWDNDADLQYNRARWYDPTLGRWMSPDPIGFEGGDANLYRYVGNHPTSATDPSGLEGWAIYNPFIAGRIQNSPEYQKGLGEGQRTAGVTAVALTASIFVPGAGESMDLAVAADPESPAWMKEMAMISFAANVELSGVGPNFGALLAGRLLRTNGVGRPSTSIRLIDDTIDIGSSINTPATEVVGQSAGLLLGHTPTTQTLTQVRNLPQPAKWKAGEQYVQELYGSTGQKHFPIPGTGGRIVDAPVIGSSGVLAVEVKTYGHWRAVQGLPQQNTVPLTAHIEQQILKDVWLRENVPGFDPRWVFLEAPPSADLVALLKRHNIVSVTYQ